MISISICIPTYNRTDMLYESFRQVIGDPRVSEIVIVDDDSKLELYNTILWQVNAIDKVKLFRNNTNLGCYRNKKEAISKATNEWVIILDSDNTIGKDGIDRIESLIVAGIDAKTVYQPEWAKPHFDFRRFAGERITRHNVAKFIDDTFCTMLNAMNYFVNRDEYLRVWQDRSEPWTADSILQALNWFKAGNSFYIVPGLQYEHRIHDGSHYQEHHRKTGNLYNEIVSNLKQLK